MTDDRAARAAREAWLAGGRKLFSPGLLFVVAIVTLIFVVAVRQNVRGWLLVFWGIAPGLFAAMVVTWAVLLWWAPRLALRRLEPLPHRLVRVELSDQQFAIQTATEQMAVDWSMLSELRQLRTFWLVCFKSGAELPLPRDAVTSEALDLLRSKARVPGS